MYIKNKNDLKEFLKYESALYNRKNCRCPIIAIKENDILWKNNYLLRKAEYYTNIKSTILKKIYRFRLKLFQHKYL